MRGVRGTEGDQAQWSPTPGPWALLSKHQRAPVVPGCLLASSPSFRACGLVAYRPDWPCRRGSAAHILQDCIGKARLPTSFENPKACDAGSVCPRDSGRLS